MSDGKKPGYARRTSQRFFCERCRCYRYGQVVHSEMGVPGIPGADPKRIVEVGKTTRCDKCGHQTTRYIDD